MVVKCYDLMKISTFKNIHLVGGASGLNRLVSWTYVLTTPALGDWVRGGELVFVVNQLDLTKILKDAVLHKVSGVVVLKNEENQSLIQDKHIDFANSEKLPLFDMDYHLKLVDVTREISGFIMKKKEKVNYVDHFFHNVLFSDQLEQKDMDDFSQHYGFHREHLFFITTIHSDDPAKLNEVQTALERYLEDVTVDFLMLNLSSYLVLLAYTPKEGIKKAKGLLTSSFSLLNERFPQMLYMAMGNITDSLNEIRTSYQNSMNAIDLCTHENRVVDFEELGFPRLFLSLPRETLKEYADFILEQVITYDKENESDFLKTMEIYILCNGSISQASAQLFIHKNTCIYRIARINELFGLDLKDAQVKAEVLNCLSIYRFLGEVEAI